MENNKETFENNCEMCEEYPDDYCPKCGTPHGAMLDLLLKEWEEDEEDLMFTFYF